MQFIDYFLHIDVYLNAFVTHYGFWTYLALFAIIFCETGLIITPMLPGDSLLFAAGSIAALAPDALNIVALFFLLAAASILGNQINFTVGKFIGPKIFNAEDSWLFNKKYLLEAHQFYQQHGGKTILFARFLPIIRTFAPFVAGIGAMNTAYFISYNIISALLWVGSLLTLGYFLGSIPVVKEHFTVVIYGIILVSIAPTVVALLRRE